MLWAALNVLIGYFLMHGGHVEGGNHQAMAVAFVGAVLMSVMLSQNFSKKDKE
ncbi:MAG: hypothetical protein ACTHNW_17860 [Mucilaginibacter sp.]